MVTPVSKADFAGLQASLAHGHMREAGMLASNLLQRHHDPLSECLVHGLMALGEGNAVQAYNSFFQASTVAPADARCYLGLAQSLFQLGHFQKAIAASQQAIRCDPGDWQAILVIADSAAAMEFWEPAIAHYNAVLEMGARSAAVHLGLGNVFMRVGRLAEARAQFAEAIRLEPARAAGYCNMANALMAMGQHREAITLYRQALPLTEDVKDVIHANLGYAHLALGNHAAAEAESRRALALTPALPIAHGTLAEVLRETGRYAEAVPHFRQHGTPESAAKAVETLYHLGDMEAFAAAQAELAETQPDNIRLAAIGAQAAAQHGPRFASHFCADPLRYVSISNVTAKMQPFEPLIEQVLREAAALDAVWEPTAKTTKGGYQTEGNLFALGTPAIARLQAVIRDGIAAYFLSHADKAERYVTHWPRDMDLTGWIVRLRKSGQQDMHIHPDGWLSGVLYARLPPRTGAEGAIGFSRSGRNGSPPEILHQPQVGELVLFPSSLYHYTVPFSADAERISIAFDLLPRKPQA